MPKLTEPIGDAGVAAIIVNYETAESALAAAASLLAQPSGATLRVLIVDNPGPSRGVAHLEAALSRPELCGRVELVRNQTNVGFGRANNMALERLQAKHPPPEFVLLMNPDAHVRSDALSRLIAALKADSAADFAGPSLRLPETAALRHAAFRFPHLGTVFQRAINSRRFNAAMPAWRMGLESGSQTRRVDWVSGACVLARFRALVDLGGFDPRFFLYWEEVELMKRAAKAGRYVLHVPGAEVFHAEGLSTGQASHHEGRPDFPAYYYDSWRLYFLLSHGRAYALVAAMLWLVGASVQLAVSQARKRSAYGLPLGVLGHVWRRVLLPLLGVSYKGKSR